MTWRIDGADGRFVSYSRSGIVRADTASRIELDGRRGEPVSLTPTGPTYRPSGRDDEVGIYLHGLRIVPGPVEVTGDPPFVPGGSSGRTAPEDGVAD